MTAGKIFERPNPLGLYKGKTCLIRSSSGLTVVGKPMGLLMKGTKYFLEYTDTLGSQGMVNESYLESIQIIKGESDDKNNSTKTNQVLSKE